LEARKINARERFLEVASFGTPDKVPLAVGGIRPATFKRWLSEGFPPGMTVHKYFNLDKCGLNSKDITSNPSEGFAWKPSERAVNLGPIPPFPVRVLRENGRYRIWVDSLGITQKGFQDDWRNGWSGFATRVFIDFPVKNKRDFEDIKRRYNPKSPERYPKNWKKLVKEYKRRDYPLGASIRGPFWWTRDMMGLKGMLMAIYKEPELVNEIMEFCAEFHIEALLRALEDVELDYVMINEDMGYKKGPMISPKTFRRFMSHPYKRLTDFFRSHGIMVIIVDSDGNVESLIPLWLEAGVNGLSPCEVAAGMNIVDLRKKYPRLVIMGGLDKRELAKDRESIRREICSKVPFMVGKGGYFPAVDHATPPDVSLKNFEYFVSLLKNICGWS